MKPKIEELVRLEEEKISKPIQFSEWAAPIVPIVKPDKTVRICGDFKVTVNPVSKLDRYPIPKIDDLLANLAGGEKFTKLDMRRAKKYVVINTHKGLFCYHSGYRRHQEFSNGS